MGPNTKEKYSKLPKWVICKESFNDGNPEKIKAAVERAGADAAYFTYVPFEFDKNRMVPFASDELVIVYGSIQVCKLAQRLCNWLPDWINWREMRCSYYMSRWGQYSVHQDYGYFTFADIKRNHTKLYGLFSNDSKIFIKPDDNEKSFPGEVISSRCFHEWLNYMEPYDISPELMCLVSRPSKIDKEWRLIIGDNKYVTGSQYRCLVNGQSMVEIEPGVPNEVINFAETIAASSDYSPAPMYCMDICNIAKTGELKLVEIGGVNCAGLYAADMEKFVQKANEIAAREYRSILN